MAQVYRGGQPHGSADPTRLTPYEVRTHQFPSRLRGVDPHLVRQFQQRLANELAALQDELRILRVELDRLRRTVRARSLPQAGECRPNAGHW